MLATLVVLTAVAALSGFLVATSNDAQAGLAVLLVPYVALPLAAVIWLGEAVAASRRATLQPADTQATALDNFEDRLAALVIDTALVGAALVVPLTALSHAKKEVVAVVVGVAVATAYFAGPVAFRRRTVGQSLLGLAVVDAQSHQPLSVGRAVLRSLIIVLEVAALPTIILAAPAIAEALVALTTGRSFTDRVLHTTVTRMRRIESPTIDPMVADGIG